MGKICKFLSRQNNEKWSERQMSEMRRESIFVVVQCSSDVAVVADVRCFSTTKSFSLSGRKITRHNGWSVEGEQRQQKKNPSSTGLWNYVSHSHFFVCLLGKENKQEDFWISTRVYPVCFELSGGLFLLHLKKKLENLSAYVVVCATIAITLLWSGN